MSCSCDVMEGGVKSNRERDQIRVQIVICYLTFCTLLFRYIIEQTLPFARLLPPVRAHTHDGTKSSAGIKSSRWRVFCFG